MSAIASSFSVRQPNEGATPDQTFHRHPLILLIKCLPIKLLIEHNGTDQSPTLDWHSNRPVRSSKTRKTVHI